MPPQQQQSPPQQPQQQQHSAQQQSHAQQQQPFVSSAPAQVVRVVYVRVCDCVCMYISHAI